MADGSNIANKSNTDMRVFIFSLLKYKNKLMS
jgi:1-deoxy-D-xylulose 5-phosphate reductoisomerase